MGILRDFLFNRVYRDPGLMRLMGKGAQVVEAIYNALMKDDALYEKLPLARLAATRAEAVRDFIAGMTDRFAINYARESLGLDLWGE